MNTLKILTDVSLKACNTLAVDTYAKQLVVLTDIHQLDQLFEQKHLPPEPFILGEGSNILLTRAIQSLVIQNRLRGIKTISETDESIDLEIASGENWHDLVCYCLQRNFHGLENLALIPGTVGAAPVQNIGAYGVEIKDRLLSVSLFDCQTGKQLTLKNHECEFSYRDSIFKKKHHQHWLITAVTLRLDKVFQPQLDYPSLVDYIERNQLSITADNVAQAVIAIRQAKLPDPKKIANAGSFFKNPIISSDNYRQLKKNYSDIPVFPYGNNQYKVPAAWLIEQCDWKGKRLGNVSMHEKQAVVLTNHGDASGIDLLKHAQAVANSVKQRFHITLTPEVNIH